MSLTSTLVVGFLHARSNDETLKQLEKSTNTVKNLKGSKDWRKPIFEKHMRPVSRTTKTPPSQVAEAAAAALEASWEEGKNNFLFWVSKTRHWLCLTQSELHPSHTPRSSQLWSGSVKETKTFGVNTAIVSFGASKPWNDLFGNLWYLETPWRVEHQDDFLVVLDLDLGHSRSRKRRRIPGSHALPSDHHQQGQGWRNRQLETNHQL